MIYWEQRKFSDLYEKVIEKNDLSFGTDKIISVASMYYKEDTSNSDDDYMRTYNVMRLGDIAFEGNKSKNFAHGRFVENTIGDGIVSHVFDVFRPISEYDLLFWKYFINYEGVMGRIMIRCTKASTMMTNLVAKDFLEESIVVPSIVEQKRIGYYLISLDHLITLHQSKYFRYILKAITSCTLSWEQRKLGEIFEEYSEKNHSELPPLTIIQGGGTIRRDESDRALQYDRGSLSNYKMVNKGDFIVHLRSFEGGLEKANSKGIISPAYHTFNGKNTDTTFYYTYFRSEKFIESDLKPHVYGIRDGRSIDIEGMKSINIPYTIFEEQRHIGYLIDSINHLITLHQLEPFQLIFKAIAYRIIDYAKSKPPRCR